MMDRLEFETQDCFLAWCLCAGAGRHSCHHVLGPSGEGNTTALSHYKPPDRVCFHDSKFQSNFCQLQFGLANDSAVQAAFITPLVKTPTVCHNEITPNDWKSDPQCAISGCFIIYGAWVIVNSCKICKKPTSMLWSGRF